jgi:hypothetical protein
MTNAIVPFFAAIVLLWLTSCSSPLDSSANRIETPLTPAIKVTPASIHAVFKTPESTYEIVGLPVFRIDTSTKPWHIWMDVTMKSTSGTPALQQFRVIVDSVPLAGLIQTLNKREVSMTVFVPSQGATENFVTDQQGNYAASLLPHEPQKSPQNTTELQLLLYLQINKFGVTAGVPTGEVFGRITLGL